jgi:hypothetical protein
MDKPLGISYFFSEVVMIMERCVQRIVSSYEDAVAMEKEFDALEAKMGNVPPKRRYYVLYGSLPQTMYVWERDWESMAALEAFLKKQEGDPEWDALFAKVTNFLTDFQRDLYGIMTW